MNIDDMPLKVQLALAPIGESENLSELSADGIAILYAHHVGCETGFAADLIDIHSRLLVIEGRTQ